MKNKLILLSITMILAGAAFAQQSRKIIYTTVTVLHDNTDDDKHRIRYIVTAEDQTQREDTVINKDLWNRYKGSLVYENIQLQILKQFFDAGWKLVAAAPEVIVWSSDKFASSSLVTTRYFLSKDLE